MPQKINDGLTNQQRYEHRHKAERANKVRCPDHYEKYGRPSHLRNRGERLEAALDRRQLVRIVALTWYGNGKLACIWCGYDQLPALSLDHVNDTGYKETRGSGWNLYKKLITEGFPFGYQTLCMNCQYLKREANGNHTHVANK